MTTRFAASPWMPGPLWWAMLVVVIATGLIGNWAIAAALTVLLLVQVARPLDFLAAFLLVVAGASMVANYAGRLTFELSLLSCAILLMLGCYALWNRGPLIKIPRTALAVPLLSYVALTIANALRGVLTGHNPKYVGLEFLPVLALGSAVLVANQFDSRRDLRLATLALIVLSFVPTARGFHIVSEVQAHTSGTYTMAVPGLVGLLIVNLSLRSASLPRALGWLALSTPLFLHQFVTFGRGLWTGCLAGLAASIFIFAGVGRGAWRRWGRVGYVVAILAGFVLVASIPVAITLGHSDLIQEAGTRMASITSTDASEVAKSKLIRLWEYSKVLSLIPESPWIGYGLGFTFAPKAIFGMKPSEQWGVHQNFLLVWLKQGVIGLAAFVWVLWSAIALGVREARRREDPWESAWFATAAGATVFLAVFSLSNYPFAYVNETFLLALLWGGAMAMARSGFVVFQWLSPSAGEKGHRGRPH